MRSCLKLSDCPKCGENKLTWTKTSKNKNWLKDENGKWHNCPVQQEKYGRGPKVKLPKCRDCPWNFGHYSSPEIYEWHRKVYHPFDEVWIDKDFKNGNTMVVECRLWVGRDPIFYPLWEKYRAEKESTLGPQEIYMGKKYKGE